MVSSDLEQVKGVRWIQPLKSLEELFLPRSFCGSIIYVSWSIVSAAICVITWPCYQLCSQRNDEKTIKVSEAMKKFAKIHFSYWADMILYLFFGEASVFKRKIRKISWSEEIRIRTCRSRWPKLPLVVGLGMCLARFPVFILTGYLTYWRSQYRSILAAMALSSTIFNVLSISQELVQLRVQIRYL